MYIILRYYLRGKPPLQFISGGSRSQKQKNITKKTGNLNIKSTYITEEGKHLGVWLSNQRRAYKSKINIGNPKIKPLTDKQVELLESIGIEWDKRLQSYFEKKITKEREISIKIRAYKFLKEYATQIKNEIETYEDIKNINNKFKETLEQLGKTKIK